MNTAGIPWQNVQALRRKGVDARLVVFERYKLHPEADWSLDRGDGFLRRQLVQGRAMARLLPDTDVFHFYFGLTLIPKSLQFPLLRATGAKIVGSYDAIRWVPDAEVVPPGIDLRDYTPSPHPPSDAPLPVVLHAPSSRRRKGTEHVIAACEQLPVELEIVEGLHHDDARRRYERADIVVDQLNAGWYGLFAIEAMALGKPVVTFLHEEAVARTEAAFETRVPIISATAETLTAALRPLVDDAAERRRIGAASRAYVEQIHDADRIAARLLDLYSRLQ